MSDWARRAGASPLGALVGLAALALTPAVRAAEPGSGVAAVDSVRAGAASAPAPDSTAILEGLPIGRVGIVTKDIFDPAPGDPLGGFYQLANLLHIRTREGTVRRQLLFERGEPWSQTRWEETARVMRRLDFLEPRRMEAQREGDSVTVAIETRDSWTTSPQLNLERGGGVLYGSIGLTERNLFGFGKSLSFLYHEDPVGISRSISYRDPAVRGSRIQFAYAASSGTAGSTDFLSLTQPFYAQDAPGTFGFMWRRSSSVVSLFEGGAEVAEIPLRHHQTEIWGGRGWYREGTIVRTVGSLFLLDRHLGPSRLEDGAPPDFGGGDEDLQIRRLNWQLSYWRPRFVVREDVDRMGRKEDFDLGESAVLTLGYAPEAFGSTASEGYVRADAGVGGQTRFGFGFAHGNVSMRLRRGPLELIRRGEARWVFGIRPGRILVLAAEGEAGTEVERDFQVVVGGLSGLRAYPVQAIAGREVVRLNAEQRSVLVRNAWDLVSMGTAVFYDAARAWGPGAVGTGWFSSAGLGMRFSAPRSAIGAVIRLDVSWPISPTDGAREAVITFGSSQAF